MTGVRGVTGKVRLRSVEEGDIDVFYDHQLDPVATEMAAFPSREKDRFVAHWAKIRANDTSTLRTILIDDLVAGNMLSWQQDGQHFVGYWVGRDYWGRGIATEALAQFLNDVTARPLYAHVAVHNVGSIRVLEKAGFQRDRELEATASPPDDGIEEFVFVLDA
ncbi:MAG TPA: GNAT family N-acetyltransferase [Rugosimonospora sp.]